MRHTKGPWLAGREDMSTIVDGFLSKWVYGGEGQEQYVAVANGRIDGDWDEVMANARLIAAAPDLLAALEYMVENARDDSPDMWQMVDDVIARAKGES